MKFEDALKKHVESGGVFYRADVQEKILTYVPDKIVDMNLVEHKLTPDDMNSEYWVYISPAVFENRL